MNPLGDAHLRTWTLRLITLLSADRPDQLAWLGARATETADVVEEVELLCRGAEGLAERGVFAPDELRELRSVGRHLGATQASSHHGLWGEALTTDPAWDDIRPLARQFLLTTLGDWQQPLPKPARPHAGDR
ncbi:hypothetical protein ACFY8O_16925 [Streptomyces argenteolus]|uniref:Uncharacterized protein n=1 Tax=Streptomyces argenteolus TaxID=67274 RepID=A0ABW6X973_9ACTN